MRKFYFPIKLLKFKSEFCGICQMAITIDKSPAGFGMFHHKCCINAFRIYQNTLKSM